MLQHSLSVPASAHIQRLGGIYVPEDELGIYRERQAKRSRGSAALRRKEQAEQQRSAAEYFRNIQWPPNRLFKTINHDPYQPSLFACQTFFLLLYFFFLLLFIFFFSFFILKGCQFWNKHHF